MTRVGYYSTNSGKLCCWRDCPSLSAAIIFVDQHNDKFKHTTARIIEEDSTT